jgi:diguanylate cyclase (GGDEF)-like protein/PAS domain S-box-containing protein
VDNDNIIHLIIFMDSSHDAEVLGNSLRNAGYAVRHKHVEDIATFEKSLKDQNWDLVITSQKVHDCTAAQIIEAVTKAGKDLPVIVYGSRYERANALELISTGAVECVGADEPQYLLLVVDRQMKSLRDRRDYRDCRNSLIESEKRNRTLLDSSRDPISYIHEGMHIYSNLSYLEIFGYEDTEEMESIPVMDLIAPEDQKNFKELLRKLGKGETPDQEFEFQAVRSNGEQFKAVMQFSPASIEGEQCTQIVIRKQTDDAQLHKELELLRKQDLLTGLYNRQHFMEELSNAVSRASKGQANSVIFYIEPDQFKHIKDTLGIAGSDMVLTDMANLIKQQLETSDDIVIARFAGTVFTIIFKNKNIDEVQSNAEKIRKAFEQHIFEMEGKTVSTTCSIGVGPIIETTMDAKKALSHAETACTTAHSANGNKVHVHTVADEMANLEQEKEWTKRLRLALKQDHFVLHYQPIVSLHAEPGERYEVLLRMLGSDGAIIMPNDFMESAKNADLMLEIDRWVMKNAARAMLEKRRSGSEIRFFIKLSQESIEDTTLLPWISKLLKAARLHGSSMVFEINESVAINNIKAAKALADGLTQLNCLFAITQAGNETPPLKYLAHFNANYIKIDGQHIQNITKSETSQEIVKTITEIARSKNIQTIAEHVQDPTCLAVLWQHGVNFIQGYYLQQPEESLNYDFSGEHS